MTVAGTVLAAAAPWNRECCWGVPVYGHCECGVRCGLCTEGVVVWCVYRARQRCTQKIQRRGRGRNKGASNVVVCDRRQRGGRGTRKLQTKSRKASYVLYVRWLGL